MAGILKGKKILITGGSAREVIDGVRHYTNHTRPADLGHRAAFLLAREGAQVTLVTPRTTLPAPDGVTVHAKSLSAADLLETCRGIVAQDMPDIFVHLANTSCVTALHPSHEAVRFRDSGVDGVELDVIYACDFINQLDVPARLGTNRYQNRVATGPRDLTEAVEAIVKKAEAMPPYGARAARVVPTGLPQALAGKKAVVTAGATAEKISLSGDVLTQFASARQGVEIALALAGMGASVTLVTNHTTLSLPQHPNIRHEKAGSCLEMLAILQKSLPADIYIGTAAITPFTMQKPVAQMPKEDAQDKLHLVKTPHMLELIGHLPPEIRPGTVVCFTGGIKEDTEALREKCTSLKVDAICAVPLDHGTRKKLGKGKTRIRWITPAEVSEWGVMTQEDAGLRLGRELVGMTAFAVAKRA